MLWEGKVQGGRRTKVLGLKFKEYKPPAARAERMNLEERKGGAPG